MNSLVRFALENGGKDYNIMVPNHYLLGYYSSGNPTCVHAYGKLYMNSRLVNYKKILESEYADFINDRKNQTYYLNENGFNSRNLMFSYNNGQYCDYKEICYPNSDYYAFYKGFEDCRFIVWDNILYAYGTRWDKIPSVGCICIYKINPDLTPSNEIIVKSPTNSICEKNWAAIEDMPFCFIYKTNETILVKVDMNGNCEYINDSVVDDRYSDTIKGSTPVIRYNEEEYISVVHRTTYIQENEIEKATYQSAFIFYDNSFNITRMSDWFVFRSELCEFTCGITIHDRILYLPYSQIDCTVNMLEIPIDKIEKFVEGGEWEEYGRDYIYNLAKNHERQEQYFTSSVLFNYAAILSKENDDIKKECVIKTFAGLISELDSIKANTHIQRLKTCIHKAMNTFENCCELNYLLSIVNRFEGNLDNAKKCIEKQNIKNNYVMPEFLNYVNINYF